MENRQLRYEYVGGITDSLGRLSYQNGETKYLEPCGRITDPDLLIGILANNQLHAERFLLTHKDKQPIRIIIEETGRQMQIKHPGKSAFLYFEGLPTKNTLRRLVDTSLQRISERRDHLHLTTVAWVEEAGWQVWWTPLPERENWLHVRLVSNRTAERSIDPSLEETTALKEAFIKAL